MRLYIYDAEEDRHGRHSAGDDETTVKVPVNDMASLRSELERLVREKKTFRRVLWNTHGAPGLISLGKDDLTFANVFGLVGQGYEKLFPQPTKMYFSGCDVADTDVGWLFLEAAGRAFLRAGGYTMGWTSAGHSYNSALARKIITSHITHYTGDVRIVTFGPGGSAPERLSYAGGVFTGNFLQEVLVRQKLNEIVPEDA